jgi:serine/threonine-protein kinase
VHIRVRSRWIAYVSDVTGRAEVWVRPYPGPGTAARVSSNGGSEPQWSRNGRELYFLAGTDTIMTVAAIPGPEFAFKAPIALFSTQFAIAPQPPSYDIAPDGRFLFVQGENPRLASMVVVVNWFEALRRRVPVE